MKTIILAVPDFPRPNVHVNVVEHVVELVVEAGVYY